MNDSHTRWIGSRGPVIHTHGFDETFYVLECEFTFQLGDELTVATVAAASR
jgi:quercetin dioxygenase-like cupin family protein